MRGAASVQGGGELRLKQKKKPNKEKKSHRDASRAGAPKKGGKTNRIKTQGDGSGG